MNDDDSATGPGCGVLLRQRYTMEQLEQGRTMGMGDGRSKARARVTGTHIR